jgi:hypothetical protein
MATREKLLLSIGGYLIAIALWFLVAQPSLTEVQTKMEDLSGKQKKQTELKIKLADNARLLKEKQVLEGDIEQLRGSVPKSPDIDILIIDLEKMCLDSGLDLVSVEEPDKDKLRLMEQPEESTSPTPPKVSGVTGAAGAAAGQQGAAATPEASKPPTAPGAANKANAPSAEVETGLVKEHLLVQAQGSYAGTVELMKKLESYQRVIGVNQVEVGFATEGKEQKKPDPKELKITFLVTAYYLP